ncbi:hypothetical protein BCR32DRAFT_298486 [Anaeromyces robustus]|uniref:EamA domain-containing protein n=1 Tax=Anaeromyces robustus TaxID=1754192 RepID=A0A1Y1VPS6_9FUNG|nr:hypothetical protein BCR32DRAFT_298486 [Anaeromyces robustus]|eukprot:ORX63269.1 hypothetical protein BCR32DRAFT_298486 [Anaeromyces robustus]
MAKTSLISTIFYSALAGTLAALASVCAKLAVDSSTNVFYRFVCSLFVSDESWCTTDNEVYIKGDDSWIRFQTIFRVLRVSSFLCLFLCNALMWAFFTKALNVSSSSIQVTVINTATNFCLTAILGYLIFNEPLSLQWWFGASLIVVGTVLLNTEIQKIEEQNKKEKKKE